MAATPQTWVVLNDIQLPFADRPVLDLVLDFCRELRPHGVVLNGDVTDCYTLSEFSKNPLAAADLRVEIEQAGALMERLAKAVRTEHIWLGGNHEDRLRRYIWGHAPALELDATTEFARLFRIRDHGFRWSPYGAHVTLGSLVVTHGACVRQHSAYTARAHFERYGSSVLVGHTHRLGIYYVTNLRGVHAGYENGCLCRLDPEYVQHPNWQQGFSVVHVEGTWFHVQQIPVLDRRMFFYGPDRIEATRPGRRT